MLEDYRRRAYASSGSRNVMSKCVFTTKSRPSRLSKPNRLNLLIWFVTVVRTTALESRTAGKRASMGRRAPTGSTNAENALLGASRRFLPHS